MFRACFWILLLVLAINSGYAQNSSNKGAPQYSYFLEGKAVSEQEYKAGVLLNEGVLLLRANKNEEAASKFKEALAYSPDFPELHHNLGVAMAKLGDVNTAITELSAAINLSPQTESCWYTLAGIYQSIGQIDKAVNTYEEFLKKFPKSDMRSRISKLVSGLKTEQKRQDKTKTVIGSASSVNNGDNAGTEDDDYLAETTSAGVFRWPARKMPIKVFIHPGREIPFYRDSFETVLQQSFADWSQASGSKVQFVNVGSAHHADIECFFVDDVSQLKNPSEAGEARVFTNKDGIARGTIKLLTKSLSPVLPLTDNRFHVICLHEIGHILGLTGHTTNPKDVMFYSESFSDMSYQLSGRDSRTISRLYADY